MSFNSFRENYPMGFNGLEGQEERTYIFEFGGGEIKINSTSEKYAEKDVLDKTIREAIEQGGLHLEGHYVE